MNWRICFAKHCANIADSSYRDTFNVFSFYGTTEKKKKLEGKRHKDITFPIFDSRQVDEESVKCTLRCHIWFPTVRLDLFKCK